MKTWFSRIINVNTSSFFPKHYLGLFDFQKDLLFFIINIFDKVSSRFFKHSTVGDIGNIVQTSIISY